MPKTVGEFLHSLAQKAGMDVNSDSVKNFLLNGELMKIEVPEDIDRGIDNQLLSVRDAKNNHPDIKSFYHKQALDAIDSNINDIVTELGLDESVKQTLDAERSTYKRVGLLAKKVHEVAEGKEGAKGKSEMQAKIDELHNQLRSLNEEKAKESESYTNQLKSFKIKTKLQSLLSGYKTIYDNLDGNVKFASLQALLDQALADSEANFDIDDKDNLQLFKKDGSNVYGENHQQVLPTSFVEQLLSRNKLLVTNTNGQQNQQGEGENNQSHNQPQGGSGKTQPKNHTLSALVSQSLKDIDSSKSAQIMGT